MGGVVGVGGWVMWWGVGRVVGGVLGWVGVCGMW